MKKRISIILILICNFLMIYNDIMPRIITVKASNSSEIVMEINSNRVVHAINENDKKFMASTTKILTAICIIENCDLDKVIEIKKETTGVEGSSIYLESGEKLSVKDLLYGLMLRSGNDCALTLAVHCSGSASNFANLMNKTALKIGANNSNFVNPHGLHDDNHYTTAYDLALISCYAMKNETFREIVSTKTIDIPFTTRNYNRRLVNKNKMLKEFEGSTGIKTGFTKKAGRCLVSSCKRNGIEFVCVVLNCPGMFERSKNLLTSAFSNYKNYKIINKDNLIFIDNKEKYPACIKNDVILPLTENEKQNLVIEYEYYKNMKKPIKKDEEVGLIKIYCKKNLLFTEKIYTILDIK